MPSIDPDAVRHFADVTEDDMPNTIIQEFHVGQAEDWLDEAGCELDGGKEERVVTRLAAASIQFGPEKEVADEQLGQARKNYVALGMAGDGLMGNANFMAAAAVCPGLLEWDKPTASITVPKTRDAF